MVDVSPQGAFLVALNNAFNAARANAPQANVGAGIPGLAAGGAENGPGSPGGPASVSIGGGAPGTATTGQSIANALLGGGGGAEAALAGPGGQQVFNALLTQRGESPERPDVPGGSVATLLALLTGGPLAIPGLIGSLVASDALGRPLDPSLLSVSGLAQLANDDSTPGVEFGGSINADGSFTPAISSPRAVGAGTFPAIRTGPRPSDRGIRDDRDLGPGRSPSRGDISNAGR
ncbi:MAG: hypothetical protein ACR2RF_05915 [Geminicoccaceae bacterium]